MGPVKPGQASSTTMSVTRVAPHIRHVVDPGGAPQHLAARHHHPAIPQPEPGFAWIGGVHPVGCGVQLQHSARSRNTLLRGRLAARLDQDDATGWILREPGGDYSARRAATHNDEIDSAGHSASSDAGGFDAQSLVSPRTLQLGYPLALYGTRQSLAMACARRWLFRGQKQFFAKVLRVRRFAENVSAF
jgi:hypothetical protein